MYEDYYEIEQKESLDFLNSYDAQEIELVDEEENYAYNIKEIVYDIDDIRCSNKISIIFA